MQKLIKRTGSTDINDLMPHMPRETQGYVRNITKSHADYQAQAKATEPKAEQVDKTVDRDTKAAAEVTVARTDTSDNIVTQTTPPPPPMLAAPAAPKPEGRSATNAQSPGRSRREVPQNIAQAATDPTSLDDMPLLLTDHGLGSILTGRI